MESTWCYTLGGDFYVFIGYVSSSTELSLKASSSLPNSINLLPFWVWALPSSRGKKETKECNCPETEEEEQKEKKIDAEVQDVEKEKEKWRDESFGMERWQQRDGSKENKMVGRAEDGSLIFWFDCCPSRLKLELKKIKSFLLLSSLSLLLSTFPSL